MRIQAIVKYGASLEETFAAAIAAVKRSKNFTLIRTDAEKHEIVFEPDLNSITRTMNDARFTAMVRSAEDEVSDATEVMIMNPLILDRMGESAKAAGRLIHEIDQLLVPGELLRGELTRPDLRSELTRLLIVAAVFIGMLSLVWLAVR
ncbi:hypothetical protein AYO40_04005 [Planctomycetaceae bacterium SCGC AG-212-D15]|nr:hypothetical protein AYO40_04005 [Planctomycetaceae bacterium SCGC AG-212-D15]